MSFANVEYVSRRIQNLQSQLSHLVVDFRRVSSLSEAASHLLTGALDDLVARGVEVVFSGVAKGTSLEASLAGWLGGKHGVRGIAPLDEAIEWAEDRIIQRQGGHLDFQKPTILAEQQLLGGFAPGELSALAALMAARTYEAGDRMIGAGDPAASLLFIGSGVVSVRLPGGTRLATLSAGMAVGEMALLETHRSADVWADTSVACLELSLEDFANFRERHPRAAEHVMANLARLLSKRLIVANNKIEALASY